MKRASMYFPTPIQILVPDETRVINGVTTKTYRLADTPIVFGDATFFDSVGRGTLSDDTRVHTDLRIVKTIVRVSCHYHPEITEACRIILPDGRQYEISTVVENVNFQNRWMRFQARYMGGKP